MSIHSSQRARRVFYTKIVLSVLAVIGFVLILLCYISFKSVEQQLQTKLSTQLGGLTEQYAAHMDSLVTSRSKDLLSLDREELDQLRSKDSLSEERLASMEKRFLRLSKLQQFQGQYLIRDYRVESPSVGLLTIKFVDLGMDSTLFTEAPTVFVQERGEYDAKVMEISARSVKLKILNAQDRFVEMDLLILTH